MNQRSAGLSVAKAITGFLQYESAEGLTPVTVNGYERDLRLWIEYQGDTDIKQIRSQHIVALKDCSHRKMGSLTKATLHLLGRVQ